MSLTLEQFAAGCHRVLAANPGVEGRKQICALVEEACKDREFLARHFGDGVGQRDILYEDPELGFCVCAHVYHDARESQPHDHGPSWAIYGQAAGETIMTAWDCVSRPTEATPGQAKFNHNYVMKPGDAYLYDVGVLHSPERK